MDAIKEVLIGQSFFKGLEPHDIEHIAECASPVKFRPGQFIFHEGDSAEAFFLIQQGKVTVETFVPGRGPITLQTVSPGDVIGWSWLFPPHKWHFDARALEKTQALSFNAKALSKILEDDHDLGYALMQRFAHVMMDRLQATRMQLLELKF